MQRFKNKKVLAIAGVSVLMLTVVGTIAYNQDSMFFANLFRLPSDNVEFSETFDSPEDWQPCQETPKTAIATNRSDTPRYVRMKINEYWRTKNTTTSASDHETTDLPLAWTDSGVEKRYAIINTQNDDKWELGSDGWYYYETALSKDESTLSLLKSVTFNCEVNTVGDVRYSADGLIGETIPTDYSEATYHLYITFQMSDEPMEPERYTADCDSDIFYDHIACLTNGPDNNIDFANTATIALGNGNGVNTLSAHQNDYYPVYYYRGEGDNYVIFNGYCWRAVRTTDTGGVKLLYSGQPTNGQCVDSTTATSGDYAVVNTSDYHHDITSSNPPEWNFFDYSYSNIQSPVYSFYGGMITERDKVEDTVYCNDKSSASDPSSITHYDSFHFSAYDRLSVNYAPSIDCAKNDAYTVSSAKGNGRLAFPIALMTADEVMLGGSTTNWSSDLKKTYVAANPNNSQCAYTMTPYMYNGANDYEMYGWCTDLYDKYMGGQSGDRASVRPVLSVKYGVTYTGTGTYSDPYVLQ